MDGKFRNKYRIQSNRMPERDYSGNGIYFITLVTQNRECNLGQINHGEIILSDFGKIVRDEWLKSFEIRHELDLDEYIIMPNHLHAIVLLDKTKYEQLKWPDGDSNGAHDSHDSNDSHVQTHGRASLQSTTASQSIQKPPTYRKPQSISSFIAGFKSAINSKIDHYIDQNNLDIPKYNRNNQFFQSNYHDHVIRNHAEYLRIKNYIISNPINWINDKFNQ